MYFKIRLYDNNLNIRNKAKRLKQRSFNKIYVNLAEIKHTNSKVFLTIYSYNREKISLLKRLLSIDFRYIKKAYDEAFSDFNLELHKVTRHHCQETSYSSNMQAANFGASSQAKDKTYFN